MTVCLNILINNLEKRGGQGLGGTEAVRDSVVIPGGRKPCAEAGRAEIKEDHTVR